jgi:hypothetical protein
MNDTAIRAEQPDDPTVQLINIGTLGANAECADRPQEEIK